MNLSDAEQIFHRALEQDGAEARAAFLEKACAGSSNLRAQIERLLVAHEASLDFLATEPGNLDAGQQLPLHEGPGTRIGRYQLLQKIGEGGMGVVYMAEQEEPVRRRVALKIIKLGMDTRSVIARFEAERQALAMMDHPNIARVLDGGATETGRPYFVMELVQGIPITEFCDKNKLSAQVRLKLFIQVCQAIQSAHQKGIIHRDLKPTNVLVTLHHGDPMPKVIDFGIAKATNQKLTEKTLFTQHAVMIGTPAYMSPEQAEMSCLDVDTRSDIYSLGVLLYELLTGSTPFSEKRLRSASYGEMQRIIVEEEPERPSSRLSTLENKEKSVLAHNCGGEITSLNNLLRGDLDWIVMKCLEKDRTRRYETANGLTADIQRHLGNEPVIARPPNAMYRFRKTIQRNKGAFVAGTAVVAALLFGLGISLWQSIEKTIALNRARAAEQAQVQLRQRAEAESQRATDEAAISTAVTDFLRNDVLRVAGGNYQRESLDMSANPNLTVAEALDRAAADIGARFKDKPLVEAAIRYSIGCTYKDLHEYPAAVIQLTRSLELYRPREGLTNSKTWNTMHQLASACIHAGRPAESIALYEEMLAFAKKHFGERKAETAFVRYNLGFACIEAGRLKEGIALIEEDLAWNQANGARRDDALSLDVLAGAYSRLRQPERAVQLAEEALKITESTRDPDDPAIISLRQNLAIFYIEAGRRNDALPLLENALRLSKQHQGPEHPDTLATGQLLAEELREAGRVAEAEAHFRELAEIARKLPPQQPAQKIKVLRGLANFLATTRQFAEAQSTYREALQVARSRDDATNLEGVLSDLADFLYRQGNYENAEPVYRELIERRRSRLPEKDEGVITPVASLGRLLADWAWAERTNKSEINQKSEVVERARESERLLRECLARRAASASTSGTRLAETQSRLGAALTSVATTDAGLGDMRHSKLIEAETLLLSANDVLQQSKGADFKYKRDSLERLARLYTASDRPQQAAEWKRQLDSFDQSVTEKRQFTTGPSP